MLECLESCLNAIEAMIECDIHGMDFFHTVTGHVLVFFPFGLQSMTMQRRPNEAAMGCWLLADGSGEVSAAVQRKEKYGTHAAW